MKPLTSKELAKYLKNKQSIFDNKSKILTNKKLNLQMVSLAEELNVIHGRNLFLFNELSQTLFTLDHLFITPKGLILVEESPVFQGVIELTPQWWQSERSGELYPNGMHQLKRVKEGLLEILRSFIPHDIPIFMYLVSSKEFLPCIDTLETIKDSIYINYQRATNHLSIQEMELIQKKLLTLHQESVADKQAYYYPTFLQTQYNPLGYIAPKDPIYCIYDLLNEVLYDEGLNHTLYHRLILPRHTSQQGVIQTLILSPKGLLLLSYLQGGVKVMVDLNGTHWDQLNSDESIENQPPLSIANPIKVIESQGMALLNLLQDDTLPLTYRIVGCSPIDLELCHPSLTIDVNLEHTLDRYLRAYPDLLSDSNLGHLKQQLVQWMPSSKSVK